MVEIARQEPVPARAERQKLSLREYDTNGRRYVGSVRRDAVDSNRRSTPPCRRDARDGAALRRLHATPSTHPPSRNLARARRARRALRRSARRRRRLELCFHLGAASQQVRAQRGAPTPSAAVPERVTFFGGKPGASQTGPLARGHEALEPLRTTGARPRVARRAGASSARIACAAAPLQSCAPPATRRRSAATRPMNRAQHEGFAQMFYGAFSGLRDEVEHVTPDVASAAVRFIRMASTRAPGSASPPPRAPSASGLLRQLGALQG
jgi:hypothetical protein